jgi:hypothetical protein
MNFKERIPFMAALVALMLAGNFLSYAASARDASASMLILALQTALMGLLVWLWIFRDAKEREKLEADRIYRILNFLSVGMITLSYFVFEGWVVLRHLGPPMQL